jgi:signal transduction histidine kinase
MAALILQIVQKLSFLFRKKLFPKRSLDLLLRLQIVGFLSAGIFAISCCFEVLYLNNLHASQLWIIGLLLVLLSSWDFLEIYQRPAGQTQIALKLLQLVLVVQLVVVVSRHGRFLLDHILDTPVAMEPDLYRVEISTIALFIYFGLFLIINQLLVEAFSASEKNRANELDFVRMELQRKLKASLTASGVAHEINQPLSTILLNIQLAMNELDQSSAGNGRLVKRLSQVESEAERVVTTIAVMRNLLRNVETKHDFLDLVLIAETVLLNEKYFLDSHRIVVDKIGFNQKVLIYGDGGQLQIAIANILRNSVEALSRENTKQRRLMLVFSRYRKSVSFSVSDNGSGFIEPNPEDLILSTTKPGGSGIGLYLVRLAAENNGGSVSFGRNKLLGGAEVTLSFSLA